MHGTRKAWTVVVGASPPTHQLHGWGFIRRQVAFSSSSALRRCAAAPRGGVPTRQAAQMAIGSGRVGMTAILRRCRRSGGAPTEYAAWVFPQDRTPAQCRSARGSFRDLLEDPSLIRSRFLQGKQLCLAQKRRSELFFLFQTNKYTYPHQKRRKMPFLCHFRHIM